MNTDSSSRLRIRRVALFVSSLLLPLASLSAQVLEVRLDGTVQSNIASPGPQNGNSNVMGYERLWSGATQSPFAFPTASQPWDYIYNNRSYSIVGQAFSLSLFIDTRLLPAPSASTTFAASYYANQVFSWAQSPSLQPYTPWMSAKLSLNQVTQSYTGDYAAVASLTDYRAANPANLPRSAGSFSLSELSSPVPSWQAGYYDVSGINLSFSLPIDFLEGAALDQSFAFSTSDASLLSGVTGNFSMWETSFVNGARTSLAQTSGIFNASAFSMRSFDPDALQPGTGGGQAGTPGITPVPEPSTYGLMGGVALGLVAYWRRRRRSATV